MSEEPSRIVRMTINIEIYGEMAKDQLTAERAAWVVINLQTKEWRYRKNKLTTMFWDGMATISWTFRDWWIPERNEIESTATDA